MWAIRLICRHLCENPFHTIRSSTATWPVHLRRSWSKQMILFITRVLFTAPPTWVTRAPARRSIFLNLMDARKCDRFNVVARWCWAQKRALHLSLRMPSINRFGCVLGLAQLFPLAVTSSISFIARAPSMLLHKETNAYDLLKFTKFWMVQCSIGWRLLTGSRSNGLN